MAEVQLECRASITRAEVEVLHGHAAAGWDAIHVAACHEVQIATEFGESLSGRSCCAGNRQRDAGDQRSRQDHAGIARPRVLRPRRHAIGHLAAGTTAVMHRADIYGVELCGTCGVLNG